MKTESVRLNKIAFVVLVVPSMGLQAQQPSGYYASSQGLPEAYQQWREPTGTYQPSPNGYYQPERLPTPGRTTVPAAATSTPPQPQAPAAPLQAPYAYPPSLKKKAAEAPKPSQTQVPPKADGQATSDLEALRRENFYLNQKLAALQGGVPVASPTPSQSPISYSRYVVRRGDSLWGLALRHRVSVETLRSINGMGPKDKLVEGRAINLPLKVKKAEPTLAPVAYYTPPTVDQRPYDRGEAPKTVPAQVWGKHVVKPQQTLGLIAQHYGVSTRAMQSANGLASAHRIYIGQELIVPGRTAEEIASLAKKPMALAPTPPPARKPQPNPQINQPVNQAAVSGTTQHTIRTTPSAITNRNRGITSYRIQKTDTLESIAKAYNLTPNEVIAFNRLSGYKLPPSGEEILLPTPVIVSL
jgi:LysM repeat protein